MTVSAMATPFLWRCVAHSAASFPDARRWPPAPGFRHALRASPPSSKKVCASRCQAATPPATRAVLLTPGGSQVLWTAAGVQLQRRAAAQARPSTSRRRARATAWGAADELRGHLRRPLVWSLGDARLITEPAPPGRSAPRRRPWALRPARAGAAGCPPSRSLPGRRWCLFRHRLPLTPPGAWVTRRPARMARQADVPPAGRLNTRVELPKPALLGAPPGPVVAGGLRFSASGAGRAPCRASPPHPS